MRTALLTSLAMLVAVSVGFAGSASALGRPVAGTLSIEGAHGTVTVRGTGTVVGRLDKGELQLTDLSPNDTWTPKVNGVTKPRFVLIRGKDINFFVPGGRYRISVKGDGVSLSARGIGVATVKANRPGDGTIAVGDAAPTDIPTDTARVIFGGGDASTG